MKPEAMQKVLMALLFIEVFTTAVLVPFAHAEEIWSFPAGACVTVIEPVTDLSDPSNGGQDLIVGSADDTLYLVEARGAKAGGELWRVPMKSTVTAIKSINDVDGDARADLIAGDMADIVYCISGGSGAVLWKYLTRGSILSIVEIPDIDRDQKSDVVVCSEDNYAYCFSGAVSGMESSTQLGNVLWKFNTDSSSNDSKHLKKSLAQSVDSTYRQQGANTVTLIEGPGALQFPAVAVGSSSDSVFCLSVAGQNGNPLVLWKVSLPGDIWNVSSCSDVDGDSVEDLIVACGADVSYFLSGKTGSELSASKAQGGAQVTLSPGDLNNDGIADGIIGDGFGNVRCVSGASRGNNINPLWTFSTGANGTVTSLAIAGDLDENGLSEIIIGSTNDTLYICTDAGRLLRAIHMSGTVNSVTGLADVNGDGKADIAAGTENSIAAVFSGLEQTPISYPINRKAHKTESIGRNGRILDLLGRSVPLRNHLKGDIFFQSNSSMLTSGIYLFKVKDKQCPERIDNITVVK